MTHVKCVVRFYVHKALLGYQECVKWLPWFPAKNHPTQTFLPPVYVLQKRWMMSFLEIKKSVLLKFSFSICNSRTGWFKLSGHITVVWPVLNSFYILSVNTPIIMCTQSTSMTCNLEWKKACSLQFAKYQTLLTGKTWNLFFSLTSIVYRYKSVF